MGGDDRRREGAVLGLNVGRPIVTDGDIVAQLCESDELFRKLLREDLFTNPIY